MFEGVTVRQLKESAVLRCSVGSWVDNADAASKIYKTTRRTRNSSSVPKKNSSPDL